VVDEETRRQQRLAGGASTEVAEAVDSSTVVLLRDAPHLDDGMEVLLLQRHTRSKAYAGAFVFPGGKVDDADRWLDEPLWTCADLGARREEIGAPDDESALGFLVAAVRETFEEAGVLLAHRRDGTPVDGEDLLRDTFQEARGRLASREDHWDWTGWLVAEGLQLDLDALVTWAWWVTPVHRPYRFDTRFFAAHLPARQRATHDAVETTAMRWTAPSAALAEFEAGRVQMRNPTVKNLESLGRFADPASAVAAARRGDVDRRRIQPKVVLVDGEVTIEIEPGGEPQTEMPT
jgi:8-oxo-dGTP pyrophosphatase MutT (NUDIX family)